MTKSSHGPQNFPALRAGISPKTEQKARNLPALCAGTLQIYAPGDPPPAFSAPRSIYETRTGELKHMGAMSCHKTLLFPLGVGGSMVWRSLG